MLSDGERQTAANCQLTAAIGFVEGARSTAEF
jgi:hypothetical protein